jgi:hypothetical protein
MWWTIGRVAAAAAIIVAVSTIAQRLPRVGALLLSLPIISVIAFVMTWTEHGDLSAIARLAKETLVLVPLGLPFFVPFAFAERLGLGFWSAFALAIFLASITISVWLGLAPEAK